EVPPAPFGKEGVLAVQFHARLVGVGLLALAVDAEVAGGDALHRGAFIQGFGRGEAGKDLDAELLGLLAQPAGEVAETDDVVAVVGKTRGEQPGRRPERRIFGEKEETVLAHRGSERRALLLPVGNQLRDRTRVHYRARQDVRADLRAFLEHAHRALGGEL